MAGSIHLLPMATQGRALTQSSCPACKEQVPPVVPNPHRQGAVHTEACGRGDEQIGIGGSVRELIAVSAA
jgi:hypothetical protein